MRKHSTVETRYDILVIGSEVPGLLSAALLAKKGFRVAIFSGGDSCSVYEKNGYRFNKRPFLGTGLYEGPLGNVFDELGISAEAVPTSDISYQVVLPDERVDVYQESGLFYEELNRSFPKEIDKVSAFYKYISGFNNHAAEAMELDPFSFRPLLPFRIRKGKKPIRGLLEGLGLSQRFQSFIRAQVSTFSNLSGSTSLTAASSILGSFRKGIYCPHKGIDGLKEMLLKKIETLKGDLIESPAREVSRNGNRWLLRTDEEAFSGRGVIGNMDVLPFYNLFLDGNRSYLKKAERIERATSPITVNIGVKDTGLPVGMSDNVIMLRDYRKEPILDNLLFMQMSHTDDGRRSLGVTCHLTKGSYGKERLREVSEKMLEGVEELCPFIDRHVEVLDIRCDGPDVDGIFQTSLKQKMGIGVLPYKISEGIFFAGTEVFPSLGFDGLVYAGEMAASAALKGFEKG